MAASADLMRAVRFHEYGDPSVLRVDDVLRPRPGAGEVLVEVRAAGVNPIDWKLRSGHLQAFMPVELPHIPGIDLAGTVSELGPGVTGLILGDDVFGRGQGAYAEYATVPAQSMARKPEVLSFVQAATLPVGGVTDRSWSVLRKGGILVSAVGMPQPERAEQHGVRASGVQAAPDIRPILAQLAALVVDGNLKPLVGQRFPLAEVEAAHRASETGHGQGRIILEVSD